MNISLHAHVSSRTVDCDGPMDRDHVMTQEDTPDVSTEDLEFAFKRQVLGSLVSFVPMNEGTLTVTSFEDGTSRLSWYEQTDEGYCNVVALFCTDECDTEARSQRDHYAEAMGY